MVEHTLAASARRVRPPAKTAMCQRGIEVSWRDAQGGRHRTPIEHAISVPFERALPTRRIRVPHTTQRNVPRYHHFSLTKQLIVCESYLESCVLLTYEFNPGVVSASGQPLGLHGRAADGRALYHVPDFFIRLRDGRALLVDVTPTSRLDSSPTRRANFELARTACERADWGYRLETEPDPVFITNLRALPRIEPLGFEALAPLILERCCTPTPIGDLQTIGPTPALVRPSVLHLLWRRLLVTDLTAPLTEATLVLSARSRETVRRPETDAPGASHKAAREESVA